MSGIAGMNGEDFFLDAKRRGRRLRRAKELINVNRDDLMSQANGRAGPVRQRFAVAFAYQVIFNTAIPPLLAAVDQRWQVAGAG
ncbi:MAG: hypothetical protein ABI837_03730 [Acidobacteriota bacterium]